MQSASPQTVSIPLAGSYAGRTADGLLYGAGEEAVIFSNMDTNDQSEWDPVIESMVSDGLMVLTYSYFQYEDDQSEILEGAVSFAIDSGARKIVLIGASRGGVASLKVAARSVENDRLIGVAALSAPIEHGGVVFYSDAELQGIRIPKLLINSELDDGADDTRKMFALFDKPKEMLFCPGDAHGTELFSGGGQLPVTILRDFTRAVLAGRL